MRVSCGSAHRLALRVGTHQNAFFQLVGVNRFCLRRVDTVQKIDVFRQLPVLGDQSDFSLKLIGAHSFHKIVICLFAAYRLTGTFCQTRRNQFEHKFFCFLRLRTAGGCNTSAEVRQFLHHRIRNHNSLPCSNQLRNQTSQTITQPILQKRACIKVNIVIISDRKQICIFFFLQFQVQLIPFLSDTFPHHISDIHRKFFDCFIQPGISVPSTILPQLIL